MRLCRAVEDLANRRDLVYHDLGHQPVPHVDEPWIAAAYSDPATHTPENKQAIRLSDELVDELLASDIIVVGAPMYNFSILSTLKAADGEQAGY